MKDPQGEEISCREVYNLLDDVPGIRMRRLVDDARQVEVQAKTRDDRETIRVLFPKIHFEKVGGDGILGYVATLKDGNFWLYYVPVKETNQ